MRATPILMSAAAAVLIGACASDLEVALSDYTTYEGPEPGGDTCPTNMCGDGNSPVIDGVFFWRLNLFGLRNSEEVKITSIFKGGTSYRLEVVDGEGDRLRAHAIAPAVGFLEHTELEGLIIEVSVPDLESPPGTYQTAQIQIVQVSPNTALPPAERFWVGSHAGVESYTFLYSSQKSGSQKPLCSDTTMDPTQVRAIVFAGDLYNPATKAIQVGASTVGWFNIACVNSAPYKMHMIGYTSAAELRMPNLPSIPVPRRRAMLNAWTAKVCSNGTSYTHAGTPIRLKEAFNLLPPSSPYLDPFDPFENIEFEALWDENGAVCIDGHRLIDPALISCAGALPSCADLIDEPNEWKSHSYVATAVPYTDDP